MPFDPHQPDQLARLERQLQLREVGLAGQRRLGDARVTLIGAGGLGCPAATYLVAAGVGALHIVDGDRVERTNLNRQVLYREQDLGRPKAEVAAERLRALPGETTITWQDQMADRRTLPAMLEGADAVVDATDNFPARFLIGDACWLLRKPLIQAAVTQFSGQLANFLPPAGPCYRCFIPGPPATGTIPGCAEAGILGAAAGVIGSWQALETLKVLLGQAVAGHVLVIDLWSLVVERLALPVDPRCPLCGDAANIRTLADAGLEDEIP